LGDITLSLLLSDNSRNPIIPIFNLNEISMKARINDSAYSDVQNEIAFLPNLFLQHQAFLLKFFHQSIFQISNFLDLIHRLILLKIILKGNIWTKIS
jgi:hypothetical protein